MSPYIEIFAVLSNVLSTRKAKPKLFYILMDLTSSRTTCTKSEWTREATRTGNLSAININITSNTSRTKGGWNDARQFVVVETHKRQLGQDAKLGWKGTRQFVAPETQRRQLGQSTKFGRKRTRQLVVEE